MDISQVAARDVAICTSDSFKATQTTCKAVVRRKLRFIVFRERLRHDVSLPGDMLFCYFGYIFGVQRVSKKEAMFTQFVPMSHADTGDEREGRLAFNTQQSLFREGF